MAKGYLNLEKSLGLPPERRIDLPEDMNNAEQMRGVWTKLGLPEKPKGYALKLGDGASESDNQMLGKYVAQAHKVGLPTAQARAMLEWWVGENAAAQQAGAAALVERKANGEQALRQAWGGAYDARIREATNLLARYDPKGETGLTGETLTTFPAWTAMLIRMSDRMAEPEGEIRGEPPGEERPLTPGQAQALINEFNLDQAKQQALHDEHHPGHKAVVEERRKLLEAAHPRPAGPAAR